MRGKPNRAGLLRVYKSGMSYSLPHYGRKGKFGEKRKSRFWSKSAAGNNKRNLMRFDYEAAAADNHIYSFTGTFSEDVSATRFTRVRRMFAERLRRRGGHLWWIAEITKRGRLHLHGVVMFDKKAAGCFDDIVPAWLAAGSSAGFRMKKQAQHAARMHDIKGWLRYLTKHLTASAVKYQRECPAWWVGGMNIQGVAPAFKQYFVQTDCWVPAEAYFVLRRMLRAALVKEHQAAFYVPAAWRQAVEEHPALLEAMKRRHKKFNRRIARGLSKRRLEMKRRENDRAVSEEVIKRRSSAVTPLGGWISRDVVLRLWQHCLEDVAEVWAD